MGVGNSIKYTLIFILFLPLISLAQNGSLKGKLVDTKTNLPVTGASVFIVNTNLHATTTTDGSFQISTLKPKRYKVKISMIGYSSIIKEVEIEPNEATLLNVELEPISQQLKEVMVYSKLDKESEKASQLNEKNAVNIINVVSAKVMERSPDINAANVLQRVSGVTIQKNSGGGEAYAMVRGLEPRYNNTLVNGVKITSPDEKARYVSLDIIPSDLLQKIEVSKTLLPEMEGDAIGGTVNLIMKDAPDSMILKATTSIGYSQFLMDRKYTTFSKSDIQQKSFYERFGDGAAASPSDFSRSNLDFKDKQAMPTGTLGLTYGRRFLNNKVGLLISDNFQNLYYGSQTEFNNITYFQNKIQGNDYANRFYSSQQLNNGLTTHIDYNINDRNKIVLNNLLLYSYFAQARTEIDTAYLGGNGGRTVAGTGPVSNTYTSITNHQFLENLKLSGKHILTKHLLVDWAGVYSVASKRAPDRAVLATNTKIDTVHTTTDPNGPYTFRQTPYYFDDFYRTWQHNRDIDYDIIGNATYKMDIKKNGLELKIGGLYRHKDRLNHQDDYDLKPIANSDGSKQYFTNINTAQWLVFNPTGNGNYNSNNYTAHEDITAGYLQAKFTSKNFDLFSGIRIEDTKQGFNIQSESYTAVTYANKAYTDALPSIMFKYKLNSKSALRLSYFKSISRPNYYELVPYTIPSNTANYEVGNPDLKHSVADNFDMRYELFTKNEDEILIGVFYKSILNPIELGSTDNTKFSPVNLGTATVGGAEVSFTKYWGVFGLTGNYAFINSSISSNKSYSDFTTQTTVAKLQSRPLQGQSDNTLNLSLLYRNEKKQVFSQLAFQYLGKTLSYVFPFYGYDYYQQPQLTLSLSAEKVINKHFTGFGKFNNLLNTKTVVKIADFSTTDTYKPSYSLGLRYSY